MKSLLSLTLVAIAFLTCYGEAVYLSLWPPQQGNVLYLTVRSQRPLHFDQWVNLGDVIEEEGRIYGDGVNIAARLEALAQPGGICISKTAFDHIESKFPLSYQFLGEQTVKNIAKPVGV